MRSHLIMHPIEDFLLLLQEPVGADQKGDQGRARPGGEHRAHAELPEGAGHPAAVQGTGARTR